MLAIIARMYPRSLLTLSALICSIVTFYSWLPISSSNWSSRDCCKRFIISYSFLTIYSCNPVINCCYSLTSYSRRDLSSII
jgi:hypothetical protein